jgi:hypothetical protein
MRRKDFLVNDPQNVSQSTVCYSAMIANVLSEGMWNVQGVLLVGAIAVCRLF